MSPPCSRGSLADQSQEAAVVIVAGGSGSRFSGSGPRKQYRLLHGEPVLSWAVRAFLDHPSIGSVVVVLPAADVAKAPEWLRRLPVQIAAGGATRSESVRNGLDTLEGSAAEVVLIHDGARPFVSQALITSVLEACDGCGVIPGLPLTDTVKEVDRESRVVGTLDRDRLRRVQTPQAFPLATLRELHRIAAVDGATTTDDAGLFERYHRPVRMVEGDPENIKVTVPIDFDLAELLASRLLPTTFGAPAEATTNPIV